MQPDPTYKRIFVHEFMVEELMRWFVADLNGARELVDALDFGKMLRLHEQSVSGTAEQPRRYADDMVWRIPFRGRSEGGGDNVWLHLILMLEFQAEVDFHGNKRFRGAPAIGSGCSVVDERGRATGEAEGVGCGAFLIPLRIRNYLDNFHMEQWRGKKFRSMSRSPPVLPIVIYNGTRRGGRRPGD